MTTKHKRPQRKPHRRTTSLHAVVFWSTGIAALVYALYGALQHRWVSDDAFISFRYAENLVRGLGLVYNMGDHVEGYSNFLWTMYSAFGLWLGANVENWALVGSITSYLGCLALLAWNSWGIGKGSSGPLAWIPVAAVLGALHPDWQIFSTSGLETSFFTLLLTLLYVILTSGPAGSARFAVAGLLVGMASMTRPEGLILTVPVALFILTSGPRRPAPMLSFAAAFLAVWVPYTTWRVSYFGDFFPNTYYAKSAAIAWYSQGACYIALYLLRYWPLVIGPVFVIQAWRHRAREGDRVWDVMSDPWRRRALLATLLTVTYLGFVLHVGGDFMFGRFLIPVTPLLLVLLELGIVGMAPARLHAPWIVAGLAAAGLVLTPYPLPRDPLRGVRGIVFEPNFYPQEKTDQTQRDGLALRPFLKDLPVQVAFSGSESRLMYYARPRVAIETTTGLTDRQIARQPLKARGRVGHEKQASIDYILRVRRTQLATLSAAAWLAGMEQEIPHIVVDMGGVRWIVLTWDSALMDSLRQRGASFIDFPTELDRVCADPGLRAEALGQAWFDYGKINRYYFAQTPDPRREALLRRALATR